MKGLSLYWKKSRRMPAAAHFFCVKSNYVQGEQNVYFPMIDSVRKDFIKINRKIRNSKSEVHVIKGSLNSSPGFDNRSMVNNKSENCSVYYGPCIVKVT